MAGKSDVFESDLLKLIFNGTPIAGIADNAAASPLTVLWLSLHYADPGDTGTQNTNELSYNGYGRRSVARSTAGWGLFSGFSMRLQADLAFPKSVDVVPQTASYFGVGTTQLSSGKLLYSGLLSPAIVCSIGITPILNAFSTIINEE